MDCTVYGILQNTGVGCHALLQGIFPSQESNPGFLHCRQILYQLSHQGSPRVLERVAVPFSRGSSQPRDRTWVSCIAGGLDQLSHQGSPLCCGHMTNHVTPDKFTPQCPQTCPLLLTSFYSATLQAQHTPTSSRIHPPQPLLQDRGPHSLQQLRGRCLPSCSQLGPGRRCQHASRPAPPGASSSAPSQASSNHRRC